MRYINKFSENKIGVGDYVVLLYCDHMDVKSGFFANHIYKVADKMYDDFPYKLEKLQSDDEYDYCWVRWDQIRLAEPHEIDALKYNL